MVSRACLLSAEAVASRSMNSATFGFSLFVASYDAEQLP